MITVISTVILLMVEKLEKVKIAFVGALIASMLLFLTDWKEIGHSGHTGDSAGDIHFTEILVELVNYEAVLIIFGVGIVVALMKEVGFFDYISLYMVKLSKGNPKVLFVSLGGLTFFISMFFDNLTAILILGSLAAIVCKQMQISPKPFIIFVAVNTIIGGIPTPVSSIPNIIYTSSYKELSFIKFMAFAFPLSSLLFIIATFYFFIIFKKDIFKEIPKEVKEQLTKINPMSSMENKNNLYKSVIILVLLLGGFIVSSYIGLGVEIVALIVAGIGALVFRKEMKHLIEEGVEWEMIVFFISLFILMGVLEFSGCLDPLTNFFIGIMETNEAVQGQIYVALIIGTIGWVIIGFINAVPAAVVLSKVFASLGVTSLGLWFSIVFSNNVAGVLTPLGSITILMALEILKTENRKVTFAQYIKITLPLAIVVQLICLAYSILLILLQIS